MAKSNRSKSTPKIASPTPYCIEDIPMACMEINKTGNIERLNRAARALIEKSQEEVLGRRIWTVMGVKKSAHPAAAALRHGDPVAQSTSFGGRSLYWQIQTRRDEDGEICGATCLLRYTSPRNELWARAFRSCETACILVNSDFAIVDINECATSLLTEHEQDFSEKIADFDRCALLGTKISELLQNPARTRRDICDPANLPLRQDLAVDQHIYELCITGVLDDCGTVSHYLLELRDVTAIRSTSRNVERISSLLESTQSNYMITDAQGTIQYVNPAACAMLRHYEMELREAFPKFSPEHLIGESVDVFSSKPKSKLSLLQEISRHSERVDLKIPGLDCGFLVKELRDGKNQLIGYSIEWIDNASRNLYHAEVDRLHAAIQAGELCCRADLSSVAERDREVLSTINEIIDLIVSPITIIQDRLERIAQGDLRDRVTADLEGDHGEIKKSLNKTLDNLNSTLSRVRTVADTVANGSEEVSSAAQTLAHGATRQAAAMHEITRAMNRTTEQTKKNAANAAHASELSHKARVNAVQGDELMRNMVSAMHDIEESSYNIRRIISVIDEIAFQTNLLALNAAVEAARAGKDGKGFAVVAEEVRSLAARSATAAKETTEMIESSIQKVKMGTEIAHSTAGSLEEIVAAFGEMTALVDQIASASNEQAQGIGDMHDGLHQVDGVTQANSASAEQSASASHQLSSQAGELSRLLDGFKLRSGSELLRPLANQLPPELMHSIEQLIANHIDTPRQAHAKASGSDYSSSSRGESASLSTKRNLIVLDDDEFGKF